MEPCFLLLIGLSPNWRRVKGLAVAEVRSLKVAGIPFLVVELAVGQNPVPLVNINISDKWMFIHPKMKPYIMPHGQL